MILVLADTHSQFFTINEQIDHAENHLGITVSSVIHLGDFGIFRPDLHRYFNKKGARFTRPLHLVEGNHEDYTLLPWLVKKYQHQFHHLERGQVHLIDGYRFLAVGGAGYMDAMLTQMGAVVTEQDIEQCLGTPGDGVDIIISHDCPRGINVPNTKGLEFYGETGFKGSEKLDDHFKPRLWLFGHHHRWFELNRGNSRYVGLPASWRGFGLLGPELEFQVVKNDIPLPTKRSFFDLLRGKK